MSTHNWMLPRFPDNYRRERYFDENEYHAGLRLEWNFRVNESNALHDDLLRLGVPLVDHNLLTLPRRNMHQYECAVTKIKKENNLIILRRSKYHMLQPTEELAAATNRQRTGNSLQQNITMSSTTRTIYQNECICGVCVMSRVKLIMLV